MRAYYYYLNHTKTTTHAKPYILTTTHSALRDKQTIRLPQLIDSRRTTHTGINDLPSSQQPPTSDDAPARDTGVLRIHLSSVGLEQISATYAPSFIDET